MYTLELDFLTVSTSSLNFPSRLSPSIIKNLNVEDEA